MRKIILHTASLDSAGAYRDAGAELTVGEKGDVTTEAAATLVESGRAVEMADPLDHNSDGRKGGSLPARTA